ncbi:MAG: N-acetylmuramoyl-L-alanine amidase, partial [Bdellovibrionota bacterium]
GFRTQLANKLGADIFLSIHMNSGSESGPSSVFQRAEGIETYILNNTSDATSRRLAQLENTVLMPDADRDTQQTDVALILKDLRLDANLAESKRLACAVQGSLIEATRGRRATPTAIAHTKRDRGVKQALFHVLLGADMPSILVEAGFLSNPRDRIWVSSQAGRRSLARAIASAVDQYKNLKNSPRAWTSIDRCKVN